jgi:hypothetical protein
MQLYVTSTEKVVELVVNGVAVPARVWEGVTPSGIRCQAYITRIQVLDTANHVEFERDLQEHAPPTAEVQAIPLRLIL